MPLPLDPKVRITVHQRGSIPEAIHGEKVKIDVDPELRKCPECGEEMACIGEDVSEDLDYSDHLNILLANL